MKPPSRARPAKKHVILFLAPTRKTPAGSRPIDSMLFAGAASRGAASPEEAQQQARAERTWWRAHRDAKQLFSEELRGLGSPPPHGPKHEIYGHFDGQPVRRILLEKTRCHLYYVVVEREDLVRIVAVSGAMKGVHPKLIEPLPNR
jgi:hypothetical protein